MKVKQLSTSEKYIIDREKYLNSIGEFRCDEDVKCEKQCEKCKVKYLGLEK